MANKMIAKNYYLPFLLLFILFSNEIFSCYVIITGMKVQSGMKSYMGYLIGGITYLMMTYDLMVAKMPKKMVKILLIMTILLALHMLTGFMYSPPPQPLHTSFTLVFAAYCIPAIYVGMKFAQSPNMEAVNRLLPYFIIPLFFLITSNVSLFIHTDEIIHDEITQMSYQSFSYYMSYFYCYSVYYFFFSKANRNGFDRFLYFVMYAVLLLSPLLCLMGGGRGAFVFICAVTIYLVMSLYRMKRKSKAVLAFIMITAALLVYMAMTINISETVGMQRILGRLTDDEARIALWMKAFDCFLESPIFGWGLGSVWWKVGFRTHNFISDLLVEAGFIGVLLTIFVYYKGCLRLYRGYRVEKSYMFFILVFYGALVQCIFSGYWFGEYRIFLVLGLAYMLNKVHLRRHHMSSI